MSAFAQESSGADGSDFEFAKPTSHSLAPCSAADASLYMPASTGTISFGRLSTGMFSLGRLSTGRLSCLSLPDVPVDEALLSPVFAKHGMDLELGLSVSAGLEPMSPTSDDSPTQAYHSSQQRELEIVTPSIADTGDDDVSMGLDFPELLRCASLHSSTGRWAFEDSAVRHVLPVDPAMGQRVCLKDLVASPRARPSAAPAQQPPQKRMRAAPQPSNDTPVLPAQPRVLAAEPAAPEWLYFDPHRPRPAAQVAALTERVHKLKHGPPNKKLGRYYGASDWCCERCRNIFKDHSKPFKRSPTDIRHVLRRLRLQACYDLGMRGYTTDASGNSSNHTTDSPLASERMCATGRRTFELLAMCRQASLA